MSIGISNSTVLYRAHSIVCIVIANNNAEHLYPNGSRAHTAHALTESTQNESALYPVVGTLFFKGNTVKFGIMDIKRNKVLNMYDIKKTPFQ